MKSNLKPFVYGFVLAMGLALLWFGAAFAEGEPPPEAPAAPPPPVQEVQTAESGEQAAAPPEPVADLDSPAPLAVMGGDLEILASHAYITVGGALQLFADPQSAVTWIIANGILPDDRLIHTYATDSTSGIDIDGGDPDAYQEQLRGFVGGGIFPNNTDATIITGDIVVEETLYGFRLEGFKVTGNVTLTDNVGAATIKNVDVTSGVLSITSQNGTIALDSVSVVGGLGAYLENTAHISAGITILNGNFSNNNDPGPMGAPGVLINSNGPVTIRGLEVSNNNDNYGVDIFTPKAVTITQAHIFNNYAWGLQIIGGMGLITLNTVEAHENGLMDVYPGIHIDTYGDISLTRVFANKNTGIGIDLGSDSTDLPHGRNLTGVDIEVSGNGREGLLLVLSGSASLSRVVAEGNTRTGVVVVAAGAITLNSARASDNVMGYGIYLDNNGSLAPQPIKLLDTYYRNQVKDNMLGVHIQSKGSVTVNGLYAISNDYMGMDVNVTNPAGTVTLNNAYFEENALLWGLRVTAQNSITWKGGSAILNAVYSDPANVGALLDNSGAPSAKPVTVESVDVIGQNYGDGLTVLSKGAITLKYVRAHNNGAYGVYLDNTASTTGAGVSVLGALGAMNEFNFNDHAGLYILSDGAVVLSYISASANGSSAPWNGIFVNNETASALKPVTASNISTGMNTNNGFQVQSRGAITVTNVYAGTNDGVGVYLSSTSGGAVKVLRTTAGVNEIAYNGNRGLVIYARGAVTLNRLTAGSNGQLMPDADGVYIDNCDVSGSACSGNWAVSLLDTPGWQFEFNENSGDGLHIWSGGAVSIKNITADENGEGGVVILNSGTNGKGGVTIASLSGFTNSFTGNLSGDGLFVDSNGAISVSNFYANDNYSNGVWLDNYGLAKPAPVTVVNGLAMYNGNGDGIHIESLGNIKVTDSGTGSNDMTWSSLHDRESIAENLLDSRWDIGDFYYYTTTGTLMVTFSVDKDFDGTLTLQRDDGSGFVNIPGAVDSGTGVLTVTYTPGGADEYLRAIITGASSSEYGAYQVSLDDSSHQYYSNGGANGLDLRNDFSGATGTVTITGGPVNNFTSAHNNSSTGVMIFSAKAVSIKDLYASSNGGAGLYVDSCRLSSGVCVHTAPLTISGTLNGFNQNWLDNIYLDVLGKTSLTNIEADRSLNGSGLNGYTGALVITTTRANWWNSFSKNHLYGIYVPMAAGTTSLNKVRANANIIWGTWLMGNALASITASSFDENGTGGLWITTQGTILLKQSSATANTGDGADLNNEGASAAPVTIQQCIFDGNTGGGTGVYVKSKSNIIWNSSGASLNGFSGAILDNSGGGSATITLLNTYDDNTFWNNVDQGLHIKSDGNVTVNAVSAGGALQSQGMYVEQAAAVTINNSLFLGNAFEGLDVNVLGAGNITLNGVAVMRNALGSALEVAGARLATDGGTITITNSTITHNGDFGLLLGLGLTGSYTVTNTGYLGNSVDGDAPNLDIDFMS